MTTTPTHPVTPHTRVSGDIERLSDLLTGLSYMSDGSPALM
jgi:hypothetical protein